MRALWNMVATSRLAILLVGLSGCGSAKDGFTPTHGQVFSGNKPAEGAQVTLVPLDGRGDAASRPVGVVGADGTFTLSTYDPTTRKTHEGAPPGEYIVLITWTPSAGLESQPRGVPQPDRLGGRYKDPTTSPFRVAVKDSQTELAPITVSESGSKRKKASPFGS